MSKIDIVIVLKQQAEEIASKGIKGWGNTMLYAANEIVALRAELVATAEKASYLVVLRKQIKDLQATIQAQDAALEEARGLISDCANFGTGTQERYQQLKRWLASHSTPPTQKKQSMTESEYKDYLSEQDRLKREAEEENQ